MTSIEEGVIFGVDEDIDKSQSRVIQFPYHSISLSRTKKWHYPDQKDNGIHGINGIKTMDIYRKYTSSKRMLWTDKILYVIYIY